MPVTPYVFIDPPVVEPYRHGLFSHAVPLTIPENEHWEYGGVEWESLAAYKSAIYPGGLSDVNGAGGAKVLPACMGVTQATPFAVYGGVATGSLGHNENGNAYWTDRARRIVELSAQWSVENALWTGGGGALPKLNDAATPKIIAGQTNTTDGAVDLVAGLSAIATWLGNNYAGRGFIHAPRGVAAYAAQLQLLKEDPDDPKNWETPTGAHWVFGAGYDNTGPGAVAVPGTTYTGQLNAPAGLAGTPSGTGGTFAANTYFWKVTAYDYSGETIGSNEITNAVGLNGSEALSWAGVNGAAGYRVYRGTATNAEAKVADVGNVLAYTDTGVATTTPIPVSNTTGTQQVAQQRYFWLYATGNVFTLAGDIETPASFGEALDRAGNQVRLLAEQPWLVGIDGGVKAAILVRTPSIP